VSEKDLRSVPVEDLVTVDFDTKTKWPGPERLPAGFDPETLLEECKDPGLGIRELHREGVDGRGIKVAIIDQALSSKRGEFVAHDEYAAQVSDYKEFGMPENEDTSMHGPAVASLLVGKTCGVAPGAELVYRAVPSVDDSKTERDFGVWADALSDIIRQNESLPPEEKIRIVSCSIGYREENPEPGLGRWIETIKKAEESGIIVVDVVDRNGIDFIGAGTSGDKADPEGYRRALFMKEREDDAFDAIFAESGGDVEAIMRKVREVKRDDFASVPDAVLREKIEQALKVREILVPCDFRTMASNAGPGEYMYNGKGGMSWSVPYLAGLYALAFQVDPHITKEAIADLVNKTAVVNKKGLRVIDPKGFIEAVQEQGGN